MTKFEPLTENPITEDHAGFTKDLRGLYAPIQAVEILGHDVRYQKPGITKAGYVVVFFTEALAPYLFTPRQLDDLSLPVRFKRCQDKIKKISAKSESAYNKLLGRLLLTEEFYKYIIPLLDQCFPDLDPKRVTDTCFIEMMGIVMNDILVDVDDVIDDSTEDLEDLELLFKTE